MTRRFGRFAAPLAAVAVVAAAAPAWAAAPATRPTTQPTTQKTPTVEEIVNETNYASYYQGSDGRAHVKMTIVDAGGAKREREMVILRWDQPRPKPKDAPDAAAKTAAGEAPADEEKAKEDKFCGEQKYYVYFQSPADVNKTAFLVWKHLDKDDDRWLYTPSMDNITRIAGTEKRTSFVGSHFFYEDVSGRNVNDDRHELINTTANYYVLKNTPRKPGKSIEFAYYVMWILKSNFVVVKIDYYDEQGRKYRTYQALKLDNVQGYPTVVKAKMSDEKIGGHTLLEYEKVKYNIGIPEALFTERFLRRTPYKYLKRED